jgi:hypothetical protein
MDFAPNWMLLGKLPNATVDPTHYQNLAEYFAAYAQQFHDHTGFRLAYLSQFNEPGGYTQISEVQW